MTGRRAGHWYASGMGQTSGRLTSPEIDPLVADVHEARSRRTLAAAELVLDIATAASTEPALDDVLRMALDRLGEIVAFSGGSISLVDAETLIVRASTGQRRRSARGPRIAQGSSPRWKVIRSLAPMRLDDVRRRGSTGAHLTRAWLGAPIVLRGEALGLVELEHNPRNNRVRALPRPA